MVYIVDQKRAGRIQGGQRLVRVKQEGHGNVHLVRGSYDWCLVENGEINLIKSIRLIEIDEVDSDKCASVAVPAAAE